MTKLITETGLAGKLTISSDMGSAMSQFTTGSENDLPTVGATANHPVYKQGKVTHVIIDYTMEHNCTALIDTRRRPTKPWECSCVRFVNTQEHCDGLLHLLLTVFRTDPLHEKLIRPMCNILCHPLAAAACGLRRTLVCRCTYCR